MTLNQLKYLVAVAEQGHFGQAAARCYVSQPSLSAAIKHVEAELGVRIFERGKTGVMVTDVGAEVIEQARRALAEAAQVKTVAQGGRHPLRGLFRLGVIHTIAPYLLPSQTVALRRLAPQMPLDIEESMTAQLDQLLKAGELDAAIVAMPYAAPGIEVQALYDEELLVVVPAQHPFARRKALNASDLDRADLLMLPAGHCLRDQVLDACGERSRQAPQGRHGNSLETLRSMVASGLGVTVMPATALVARYDSPLVRAIPLAAPPPQRRVVIAWRQGFTRPLAIRRIAEAIAGLDLPTTPIVA